MARFKVTEGTAEIQGVKLKAGEEIDTELDLVAMFPNKFVQLPNPETVVVKKAKPAPPTVEPDTSAEDEGTAEDGDETEDDYETEDDETEPDAVAEAASKRKPKKKKKKPAAE